ncbi:phage tail protein [Parerythrobacter aestuarii]|uniref:phage tail protein n=1 Tax=Parerythrobacter aestuarii TaxID=3020909 RepID=UPI0024DEBE1B|nr:tail fiber protein [Parerythrobacter aestuarii]
MARFKTIIAAGAALVAATALPTSTAAQSGDRYLGEIIMVGMNFCPRGTLEADGRLLPISQNTALFSLLGTMYGGDGRTTFALPDLRGRVPVGQGRGPGLDPVRLGEKREGGAAAATENSAGRAGTAKLGLRFCVVAQGMYPSRN